MGPFRDTSRRLVLRGALAGVIAAACVGACSPKMVQGFDSPEPAARNVAIVQSVDQPDSPGTLRGLVSMLSSDDPATRLLAIAALERRTGQRLGYDPGAPDQERKEAIRAWDRWLAEQPEPASAEAR
jgi:hypothetical protein